LVSDVFVEGIKEKFSKIDEMLFDLILSFPPQSHTEQKPLKYVILEQLPGKGFSKPLKYARLFFEKKADRKKFIDDYNKKLTLANDDTSLENLIFRKTRINTCGWNKITNFQYFSEFAASVSLSAFSPNFGEKKGNKGRFSPYEREDPKKLPIQVVIQTLQDLKPTEGPEKDNSIICGWDLETYTPNKFGRVPMPKYEKDVIKMCSMTFRFYHSNKPLLWVLITAIPIDEKAIYHFSEEKTNDKNFKIKVIQTENIPYAFAQVLAQMQPDFLSGFNDGFYDWPFIKARTENPEEFLQLVSAIRLQPWEKSCFGPMSFDNIYNKPKTIKIDAETSVLIDGYNIPGCVVFDTAPLMRRREKTETEWSLNTFLKKHGLEAKYDMSYTRMSKIFCLYSLLPFSQSEKGNYESKIKENDAVGEIAVNNLTETEINELLADAPAVGYYCLRDAEAVLNLLHKLFIIQDIREMGNISFTHTKDGFYKADGIKVRNCLLAEALLPDWGIWPQKYPLAFTVFTEFKIKSKTAAKEEKTKYPGGYVIRPLRGIYGKTEIIHSPGEESRVVSDRPNSGLDFASLYPSLIMAYNFSPEYYIENEADFKKTYPDLDVKTLHIKTYFKKDSEFTLEKFKREGWFIQHRSFPLFASQKEGESLTRHKSSNEIKGWEYENHGIFPIILRRLFAARKIVKGQMAVWQVILEKLTRDVSFSRSSSQSEEEKKEKGLNEIIDILKMKIEKIREVANSYQGQKKKLEEMKIYSYETAIKLICEKWKEFPSYEALLEAASFKFNYYNTKQNAIKVFMNTFYGETGSTNQ
jgi:DNA polymerase elongation subunit (family B)